MLLQNRGHGPAPELRGTLSPSAHGLLRQLNIPAELFVPDPDWAGDVLGTIRDTGLALLAHRPGLAPCHALIYEAAQGQLPVPVSKTWEPFVASMEIKEIAGTHLSCVSMPNVTPVARDLNARVSGDNR